MGEKIKVVVLGSGDGSKGKSRLVEMAIENLRRLHGEENVEVVRHEGPNGLEVDLIEVDEAASGELQVQGFDGRSWLKREVDRLIDDGPPRSASGLASYWSRWKSINGLRLSLTENNRRLTGDK